MPPYEYKCQSCGETFEVIQKFSYYDQARIFSSDFCIWLPTSRLLRLAW